MSIELATAYRCRNDERLAAVRAAGSLNGIASIELVVPPGELTELPRRLLVRAVAPVDPVPDPGQVRVTGSAALRPLEVVATSPSFDPHGFFVTLATAGDLSQHELRLVDPGNPDRPPPGFDPVLSRASFSFGVVCQAGEDCEVEPVCPPPRREEPRIDRLARDFPGFRRVLLDRIGLLQPTWTDRHAADVRTTLVELLAYLGDRLSYQQDAVATEAYLGTARRRVSVRRHARLVDYHVHDGASARAFVQLELTEGADIPDAAVELNGAVLLTAAGDPAPVLDAATGPGARELARRRAAGDEAFQVVRRATDGAAAVCPATWSTAHHRMRFHTWSGSRCCLAPGATAATLSGHLPALAAGDVLVLAVHRDPATGLVEDADPARRHPVRLTRVEAGTSALPLTDPATGNEVTEIAWSEADALPFALTVSTTVPGTVPTAVPTELDDVGVALGNIALVEHGAPFPAEQHVVGGGPAWRPVVAVRGVSQSPGPPADGAPATALRRSDPGAASADLTLTHDGTAWTTAPDLIGVGDDTRMVAEVDDAGVTALRFGRAEPDGTYRHGRPPVPEAVNPTPALVTGRAGVGEAGNVGAGAIRQLVRTGVVADDAGAALSARVAAVSNPLAAWGGAAPESVESVRQRAPYLFGQPERAVTADDYARRAEEFDDRDGDGAGVQRAVAQIRWTGSWHTVFVAVDRAGGLPVDRGFEQRLRAHLDRYRMAGHDVEIEPAVAVPLEVALVVRLDPTTFRAVAGASLADVLSSRRLPDGRLGLFHPDRLTFGQTMYLSPIVAAAQAVAGVVGVSVTRFGPYRRPGVELRDAGYLSVGRNEIPRLDGDPSRPEHGVLTITLQGGR